MNLSSRDMKQTILNLSTVPVIFIFVGFCQISSEIEQNTLLHRNNLLVTADSSFYWLTFFSILGIMRGIFASLRTQQQCSRLSKRWHKSLTNKQLRLGGRVWFGWWAALVNSCSNIMWCRQTYHRSHFTFISFMHFYEVSYLQCFWWFGVNCNFDVKTIQNWKTCGKTKSTAVEPLELMMNSCIFEKSLVPEAGIGI